MHYFVVQQGTFKPGKVQLMRMNADRLLEINRRQAGIFQEEKPVRLLRREEYQLEFVVLECSDGRENTTRATKTPTGIFTEMREIGAKFDPALPMFQKRFSSVLRYAVLKGRQVLIIVTYHFSNSKPELGCAGHACDHEAASKYAAALTRTINEGMFGGEHGLALAIRVGYDTDEDALYFHDWREEGHVVSMADMLQADTSDLRALCTKLYPHMSEGFVKGLIPLMSGNIQHIQEVRANGRQPEQREHGERIIAFGNLFDWLTSFDRNFAIVLNDLNPMVMKRMVAKAAGIILQNRDEGRIRNTNAMLFTQIPYLLEGQPPALHTFLKNRAKMHSLWLAKVGREAIMEAHPEDASFFVDVSGILNRHTCELEIIER